MNTASMLVKSLEGERLSSEERIELSKGLIAENVAEILTQKILIAQHGGNRNVDIKLTADQCRDSDENIRNFIGLLGGKKIRVTSDFPGYNESYIGTTRIKFKT